MYEVEVRAMPNNPAKDRVGDKSGLWYVGFRDVGSGSIIDRTTRLKIHAQNLTYEEASEIGDKLELQLNPRD